MNLVTTPYAETLSSLPATGRHITAQFDDSTIVVYQAYCPQIGEFAIKSGYFGGGFGYGRMSWIKPGFLWMMYRSDWGRASGQEVVLAIRLRRQFFDEILRQAVPSSFDARLYGSEDEWQAAVKKSEVRLQFDPDHLPGGDKLERRAIQLGLRGSVLKAYGQREIVEIIDMREFVAGQRKHIGTWKDDLIAPVEKVYVPSDSVLVQRLGLGSDAQA